MDFNFTEDDAIDIYDQINAPQYLDFNELAKNNGVSLDEVEDPADNFFNKSISITSRDSVNSKSSLQSNDGLTFGERVSQSSTSQDNFNDAQFIKKFEPQIPLVHEKDEELSVQEEKIVESQIQAKEANIIKEEIIIPHNNEIQNQSKVILHQENEFGQVPVDSNNDSLNEEQVLGNEITKQMSSMSLDAPVKTSELKKTSSVASLKAFKQIEKRVTVPKPFNFHSSRQRIVTSASDKSDGFVFKARPAPLKILKGLPAMKERSDIKITLPKSPHFASEDRIRERHGRASSRNTSPNKKENTEPKQRTLSLSRRGIRSPSPLLNRSVALEHKTTVIKPFSFEERDKDIKKRRAEKLQKEFEEERKKHEFHANPLPRLSPAGIPPKKPPKNTQLEPFALRVDERGEAYREKFLSQVEEERRALLKQAEFRAQEPKVLFEEPFQPHGSEKEPTEVVGFPLQSDLRAHEREAYDNYLKEKENYYLEMKQKEEAAKLAQEEEQAAAMRKKLVHKALPFKNPRPFEVKSSHKELTQPHSPAFAPLPSQRRNLHQIHHNAQE